MHVTDGHRLDSGSDPVSTAETRKLAGTPAFTESVSVDRQFDLRIVAAASPIDWCGIELLHVFTKRLAVRFVPLSPRLRISIGIYIPLGMNLSVEKTSLTPFFCIP